MPRAPRSRSRRPRQRRRRSATHARPSSPPPPLSPPPSAAHPGTRSPPRPSPPSPPSLASPPEAAHVENPSLLLLDTRCQKQRLGTCPLTSAALTASGFWLLASGFWLLASGSWLLPSAFRLSLPMAPFPWLRNLCLSALQMHTHAPPHTVPVTARRRESSTRSAPSRHGARKALPSRERPARSGRAGEGGFEQLAGHRESSRDGDSEAPFSEKSGRGGGGGRAAWGRCWTLPPPFSPPLRGAVDATFGFLEMESSVVLLLLANTRPFWESVAGRGPWCVPAVCWTMESSARVPWVSLLPRVHVPCRAVLYCIVL
ncbi:hypothetical protein BJ546DRAFT_995121 [Cryomyces antarcticus]